MSNFNHQKYRPSPTIEIENRTWPDSVIETAPNWCAVDLRDGNQALIEPMSVEEKLQMWDLLVKVGFKEIEIGFPSASQPDFDFARRLIEENRIPEDVTIQVLVQAREQLIERTYEAVKGAPRVIVHVYNSTNPTQRKRVFNLDQAGVKDIAVQGAQWVKDGAAKQSGTSWSFQYSPESFSQTEVEFAAEVCDAVVETWDQTGNPIIINLPATVEVSTPNIFADQVELFCRLSQHRSRYALSIHTHNDRGCGVAAAEMALMAGADRIEGTLLGNGERTGNMDIVTMAMNMYSQGIDPRLDFSIMDEIIATVGKCTNIPLHPRHPYAGDLVFTAFSGSHQDAIRKCLAQQQEDQPWDVAYLPIDPADLGRTYQDVIRINSQSGKGGVAYVLESVHHLNLPRWLQIEASRVVQRAAEISGKELTSDEIWQLFSTQYLSKSGPQLATYSLEKTSSNDKFSGTLSKDQAGDTTTIAVAGEGDGNLAAVTNALEKQIGLQMQILDYSEHAISKGTDSLAAAYVLISVNGQRTVGVAIEKDSALASMQAVVNAAFDYQALSLSA